MTQYDTEHEYRWPNAQTPAPQPKTDSVICPGCCHQFQAICLDDQQRLADLRSQRDALLEALSDWEQSMGVVVRRGPPMCDPGFMAIYQNMQRVLAQVRGASPGASLEGASPHGCHLVPRQGDK